MILTGIKSPVACSDSDFYLHNSLLLPSGLAISSLKFVIEGNILAPLQTNQTFTDVCEALWHMKPTSVNITALSMVGIQSAYSEVGHNSEKSWDSPRIVVKSSVRVPSTWVMYLAESSAPLSVHGLIHDASCPLPFTHFWFASNLNWAILTFFLVSDLCVHLSQPSWLSPFFFSFPTILSHPRFVSVTQTFPPGSIRTMNLEHIFLIIHYQPFTHSLTHSA